MRARAAFVGCVWMGLAVAAELPTAGDARVEDADRLCRFVADRYAYFERKATDWNAVCIDMRERTAAAADRGALINVLEDALDQLYDPHAHLGTSTRVSHRLIPTDSDVHATWKDGRAIIDDVRAGSSASKAGLRVGMEVVRIDGLPAAEMVGRIEPRHVRIPDPAARDWALDVALAGRQDRQPVRVTIAGGGEYAFVPDRVGRGTPVTWQCIGGVARITFDNSLGDQATITAFDDAVAALPCRRALVLDLRDTPSGGNTTVARAIIGRLVASEAGYQRHELPAEFRETGIRRVWVEHAVPRTPSFDAPVVVLVGHWTGSMGEGLAIGLDAARGAPVVGRPMAKLLGGLDQETLPNSRIVVRIPAERLSHVDGNPREDYVPCPLAGRDADDELAAAVRIADGLARAITNPVAPAGRLATPCRSPVPR